MGMSDSFTGICLSQTQQVAYIKCVCTAFYMLTSISGLKKIKVVGAFYLDIAPLLVVWFLSFKVDQ